MFIDTVFYLFDNRTDDFLTCFLKTTSRHPQYVVKKIRSKNALFHNHTMKNIME